MKWYFKVWLACMPMPEVCARSVIHLESAGAHSWDVKLLMPILAINLKFPLRSTAYHSVTRKVKRFVDAEHLVASLPNVRKGGTWAEWLWRRTCRWSSVLLGLGKRQCKPPHLATQSPSAGNINIIYWSCWRGTLGRSVQIHREWLLETLDKVSRAVHLV